MASKSNKSNSSSSSSKSTSSRAVAEAASNNRPQKSSYLEELDEDKINEEKAQFRYDEMMQQFKQLTRKSDNDEENENLERFYKSNVPKTKKNQEEHHNSQHTKRATSRTNTNGTEKDSYIRNEIRAPNELKEEFLVYIMEKKWEDAFKLCKFILMYEPDNAIAREYLPLIEIKLNQSESESEDDEDDDDDDDDDSDKDGDDEDEDDEDDDDEEDESEEDEKHSERKRQEAEEVARIREMYKQMKPKEDSRIRSGGSTSSRNSNTTGTSSSKTTTTTTTKTIPNSSIKKSK